MQIEIRADTVTISGYVNAVERDSKILDKMKAGYSSVKGDFVERIESGVFNRSLAKKSKIPIMLNHSRELTATDITIKEDNIGLYAKFTTSDEEVRKSANDGSLTGWSFGFVNPKEYLEDLENGLQRRVLTDLDLTEISILTIPPAYIATSIEVRAFADTVTSSESAFNSSYENIIRLERKRYL